MNRLFRNLATVATLVMVMAAVATGCAPSSKEASSSVAGESTHTQQPAPGEAPATATPAPMQPSPSPEAAAPSAPVGGTHANNAQPAVTPRPRAERPTPVPARPYAETPAERDSAANHVDKPEANPTRPAPVVKTILAGTVLDVIVDSDVSSQTSELGQPVRARMASDLSVDGRVVVPTGAVFEGTVVEVVPQKKIGGTSKLSLEFSSLRLPSGDVVPVSAAFTREGKSQTGKDAATIGGSAAGGALLGKILGGSTKDAAIGAVVGGAVGTAVAAKNKGDAVELLSGDRIELSLSRPAEITLR